MILSVNLTTSCNNYTYQQLRENGVGTHPIPFSVCLTCKYDKAGEIDRYKTRMALAGHRGNIQPGVHFDRTYSSTPVQYSSKILRALMVKYKVRRLVFDIKMAYCYAKIPCKEQRAILQDSRPREQKTKFIYSSPPTKSLGQIGQQPPTNIIIE